jgi:hypothetical protein
MSKFKPGDTVAFSQAVIRRCDVRAAHGASHARGTVVDVTGPVVRVDWRGTWIPHENGGTIRSIPSVNLTRVFANGVVFGD